ncbi:MAG: hypothetical protein WKF37_23530 [Bryobacteraceae bacterium]
MNVSFILTMRQLSVLPLVLPLVIALNAQEAQPLVSTVLPTKQAPVLDQSFEWTPALGQSMRALLFQHGFRLAFQPETRQRLSGPFFRDYVDSIASTRGWGDGDPFYINYVGHTIQGAATGYIQIQNDPKARNLEFANTREYWQSRLKAFAWSAAYSTQFEYGPMSEASIGNVGIKKGSVGYVDLVTTPAAGLALIVAEDWLDKRFIKRWEDGTNSVAKRTFYRIALNPGRSLGNILQGKGPWHREQRSLLPARTTTK